MFCQGNNSSFLGPDCLINVKRLYGEKPRWKPRPHGERHPVESYCSIFKAERYYVRNTQVIKKQKGKGKRRFNTVYLNLLGKRDSKGKNTVKSELQEGNRKTRGWDYVKVIKRFYFLHLLPNRTSVSERRSCVPAIYSTAIHTEKKESLL